MNRRLGALGTAPCGHAGEVIIGSYVRCGQGCDTKSCPDERMDDIVAACEAPYEWRYGIAPVPHRWYIPIF